VPGREVHRESSIGLGTGGPDDRFRRAEFAGEDLDRGPGDRLSGLFIDDLAGE